MDSYKLLSHGTIVLETTRLEGVVGASEEERRAGLVTLLDLLYKRVSGYIIEEYFRQLGDVTAVDKSNLHKAHRELCKYILKGKPIEHIPPSSEVKRLKTLLATTLRRLQDQTEETTRLSNALATAQHLNHIHKTIIEGLKEADEQTTRQLKARILDLQDKTVAGYALDQLEARVRDLEDNSGFKPKGV